MAPKPEKSESDPYRENMVRNVYRAEISGPYQLSYGSGPIFFCSVNKALVSHTSCFQTILFEIIRKKEPWKYMDKVTDLQVLSHTAKNQETKNKTLFLGNRIYSFALT